jgi:hypothetical protein
MQLEQPTIWRAEREEILCCRTAEASGGRPMCDLELA